jgi:MFS family permease
MWVQAIGIALVTVSSEFTRFASGAALLGFGTAMVYPTLLATVDDIVHPSWRASAVGVYRLWRDLGYAAGALLVGLVADRAGASVAMWIVAILTFSSGIAAAFRMTETLHLGITHH